MNVLAMTRLRRRRLSSLSLMVSPSILQTASPLRPPSQRLNHSNASPPMTPLCSVNMIMMNTVSTANSAFWFRRKMLNGL
jgi:hypothetical protein